MTSAVVVPTALQRCLNSPYLAVDESMRQQVQEELAHSRKFYEQAQGSFDEEDQATGLKEVWAAMYHAARALVYQAGYRVVQLRCLEVALQASYPEITNEDILALRRAQALVGPPDEAMARARAFMDKASSLL